MEKDKKRFAIVVGMLACSMLILAAFLSGCVSLTNTVTMPPPFVCPHAHDAAFYHHVYTVPPHPFGMEMYHFYVEPAPWGIDGKPIAQPCPIDTLPCQPDSVKCTACGAKLWPS